VFARLAGPCGCKIVRSRTDHPQAAARGDVMSLLIRLSLATIVLPLHAATAVPTLGSLWPNVDGTRWTFRVDYVVAAQPDQGFVTEGYMQLAGTAMTPGGQAQVLMATHPTPVAKAIANRTAPDRSP